MNGGTPQVTPDDFFRTDTAGTVVTDGVESALEQARAVAGDRAIAVGSADVAQQYVRRPSQHPIAPSQHLAEGQ